MLIALSALLASSPMILAYPLELYGFSIKMCRRIFLLTTNMLGNIIVVNCGATDMSPPKLRSRIMRLLRERFPWGLGDCPPHPVDDDDSAVARAAIRWVKGQLDGTTLESTALALHARIQEIVEELQDELPPAERARFFYRSDLTNLIKSPESVLDKIDRSWDGSATKAPEIGFLEFRSEMEDLSRFRIVLNFLEDVETLCRKLEEPYRVVPSDFDRLTAHQKALYQDFMLRKNCFDDLIMLEPRERKSGQRCHKGVFALRADGLLKVEVQIQTMLQEAWDKKDHILVYEQRRRGETIDLSHSIETYAMSEVLYVVDLTFDRLLEAIRRARREGEGS